MPRFEALAYVLPHFDALTCVVTLVSSAITFQRFSVCGVIFCLRKAFILLNLCKAYIDLCLLTSPKRSSFRSLLLNFNFGLSLHIVQHGSSLSLENVCDSWCMHQTGFSSAAGVPQSKFTELCSWVAVVSQSKSTELCSLAAVVPQSKSTELRSSAPPFDRDVIFSAPDKRTL